MVAEGVKRALEERAAASQEEGGTKFGVTSMEASREAERFREECLKLLNDQVALSRSWTEQTKTLEATAQNIAEMRELMRVDQERDNARREEERMAEGEKERARQDAAEKASQDFARQGQEHLEALQQKMAAELEELRNARAQDGRGVATLTESALQQHQDREKERVAANESKNRTLGRALDKIDAGTRLCGKCKQPSKSTHMCTNTCEGVCCKGDILDQDMKWIRPPIGKGAVRLPGFQCLDQETREIMSLGIVKVKELRAMSRQERLDEALKDRRKCWECGTRCTQVNPPCTPVCRLCGKRRNFMAVTYRVFLEAGGEAADESQVELYEKAANRLAIGMKNARSAYTQAVFDQQLTDCVQVQELQEWDFMKETSSAGVMGGKFKARTDLNYAEAHGLEDSISDAWDSETVKSTSLSRASGASALSIITGAQGLLNKGRGMPLTARWVRQGD